MSKIRKREGDPTLRSQRFLRDLKRLHETGELEGAHDFEFRLGSGEVFREETGMKELYPEDGTAPYKRCTNPDCKRVIRLMVVYCCEKCMAAHLQGATYENEATAHSDMCWVRHEERWHEGYRVKKR